MKRVFISTLFILLIINGFLMAQETITLSGNICDSISKNPLPGTNVFLWSNPQKGTTTGNDGHFVLRVSNNQINDTIIVSFIGYKEQKIPAGTFVDNNTLFLSPRAKLIEPTVIKARRIIAEEFTPEQIKQMDIYLNPVAKADPLLAVNALPSSTTLDESASISLRGSSPAETGIFFNHVPVYDAVRFAQINGIGTFSLFNTSIVDRMHVFPGNPPLELGNSTSGTVSIQSSNQIPENNITSLSAGLASFGALTTRKINENCGMTMFGNYQPSVIFIAMNQESMADMNSFNSVDAGMHFLAKAGNSASFKAFVYGNNESYDIKFNHPGYTGNMKQSKKRLFGIANYIYYEDDIEFSFNGGTSFSDEGFIYGNTDLHVSKKDVYFSANFHRFYEKFSFKTGAFIDTRFQMIQGQVPGYDYARSENHPDINIKESPELIVTGIYLYGKFNLSDKWLIGSGVRKNLPVQGLKHYLSGQINLNYKPNPQHKLNFSLGHYNKYNIPNTEIREFTLFSSRQISIDYTLQLKKMKISSSVFNKMSKAEIHDKQVYGGELYFRYMVNKLETQLTYTFIDAKLHQDNIEYPSEYDMNYFIRASVKCKSIENTDFSSVWIFRQGSYYQPVKGSILHSHLDVYEPVYAGYAEMRRLPSYNKLDISLSRYWEINDCITLITYASITNILNHQNVYDINYTDDYSKKFYDYFSKRSFYVGGMIRF